MNKFLGLLEGEAELCSLLLLVLQEEKRAFVDSELKALYETSKEKENLRLKIQILEEQRLRMLEKLADSLGCAQQKPTLTELSELVGEPYSTHLNDCYSNLLAITESIRDLNRSNKSLITHSLGLVRGSLTLLDNLVSFSPVYYRTGEIQACNRSGKVLSGRI